MTANNGAVLTDIRCGNSAPPLAARCASGSDVQSNRRLHITSSLMTSERAVQVCEPMVVAIARSLCGDAEIRSDLEQEGRIAVLLAHRSYEPDRGTSFGQHAYAKIRLSMIDYLRDSVPHVKTPRGDGEPLKVESHGLAGTALVEQADRDSVEQVDQYDQLRDMLSRLPANERDAVQAIHVEGVTLRAAAVRFGCSHVVVKKRADRALKKMRAWATE